MQQDTRKRLEMSLNVAISAMFFAYYEGVDCFSFQILLILYRLLQK